MPPEGEELCGCWKRCPCGIAFDRETPTLALISEHVDPDCSTCHGNGLNMVIEDPNALAALMGAEVQRGLRGVG